MLSRLAFSAARNYSRPLYPSLVNICRTSSSTPGSDSGEYSVYAKSGTKFPWEGPERDVVNFPRPVQQEHPGKVRLLFIPDEWFQFFYKKTGVTGPYVFGAGLFSYLMSKEIWIIDHEYYYVYATFIIFYFINRLAGAKVGGFLDNELAKDEQQLKSVTEDEIADLKAHIENEKKMQWQTEGQKLLIDAKKENVALQQEAAYRERAMLVYTEIKKRLEFHAQKQIMERRVAQKHMCDWIVSHVLKSITPQQEQDTLKKCIVDLQALSSRA